MCVGEQMYLGSGRHALPGHALGQSLAVYMCTCTRPWVCAQTQLVSVTELLACGGGWVCIVPVEWWPPKCGTEFAERLWPHTCTCTGGALQWLHVQGSHTEPLLLLTVPTQTRVCVCTHKATPSASTMHTCTRPTPILRSWYLKPHTRPAHPGNERYRSTAASMLV